MSADPQRVEWESGTAVNLTAGASSKDKIKGIVESPRSLVYLILGLLVVYAVIRGIVGALWRPLWYDELLTLSIAGQPSLHDSWQAIKTGFDTQPPAFDLLERAMLHLFRHAELALRLPSILAFAVTLVCTFVYAKNRNGEIAALLSTISLLPTLLFHIYAIEARPYGLVVASMAFALVCYQRIGSRGWAMLFGLALVVAEMLHYYAVFAMIPFWIAEGVRFLRTRQFRWTVFGALVCGMLPLVVFFPLLTASRAFYGIHMFSRPAFGEVKGYPARYFLLDENPVGLALAALAVVGVLWSVLTGKRGTNEGEEGNIGQAAVLVSLVALPYIMFVLLEFAHGALLNRYVLVTTLGIVLGIASAFTIAGRKALLIYGVLVVCVAGATEQTFWHHPDYDRFGPDYSAMSANGLNAMKEVIEKAGRPTLPIVVSDFLLQAQFVYYFEPELKDRMVNLVDPKRELEATNHDSSSRLQLAFSRFFPLKVADFSTFTSTHNEFLLYSGPFDWYTPIFIEQGYLIQPLATGSGSGSIYLVKSTHGASL